MKPVISLIIPTYNCEEYLRETADSVLSQLPENCELILVDDGSTDATPEILRSYDGKDDRIRIAFREHGGVSEARNAGIDMARGEWVAFMDCDDCLKTGFFMSSIPLLEHKADLYIFSFERVDMLPGITEDGEQCTEEVVTPLMVDDRIYDTASDYADEYVRKRHLLVYSACNKLYRKSILDEHGIRFAEGMSFGEDRLFNYDYLMHTGKIVTSRIRMFRYMQRNPESASRRSFPDYFDTIMKLHRAKMDCFLKLSRGTTRAEKSAFIGADLSTEVERMTDRFEEHPNEQEENLPKINELIFGPADDISGSFDVVIVLGSTNCGYRLDRACEFARSDPHTLFLVTGGNLHRDGLHTEAGFMAERLRAYGIPENRILVEDKAVNTYSNLELSAEMIEKHFEKPADTHINKHIDKHIDKQIDTGSLRIGIVTAGFHIPRTRQMTAAIPWYEDKEVVFVPAYGANTRPDNWFLNHTGRNLCLGEIAKCIRNRGAADARE